MIVWAIVLGLLALFSGPWLIKHFFDFIGKFLIITVIGLPICWLMGWL